LFAAAEGRGMVVPAAVDDLCRVIDVEHLVEDDVLDDEFRDKGRIERFADDDGLVGGIVVAEDAIGFPYRPGQRRFRQGSAEIGVIERIEDLFEVVDLAFGGGDDLSAMFAFIGDGPNTVLIGRNGGGVYVFCGGGDAAAIKFGDQDQGKGTLGRCRKVPADLGDANENMAVPYADGVVDTDVRVKTDVDRGRFPVFVESFKCLRVVFCDSFSRDTHTCC